jgi:hypothetical protein
MRRATVLWTRLRYATRSRDIRMMQQETRFSTESVDNSLQGDDDVYETQQNKRCRMRCFQRVRAERFEAIISRPINVGRVGLY